AILRLDRLRDLTRLQREEHLFKFWYEYTFRCVAQITAGTGRTDVLGIFLGQRREIATRAQLLLDFLSLGECLLFRLLIIEFDKDMGRLTLFLSLCLRHILLITLAERLFTHTDLTGQRGFV